MTDKIKSCKPSLITNRPDFNYRLEFTDSSGADWDFGLHTLSAKQRGAIQASYATVKLSSEGKAETIVNNNMELMITATIYNALESWCIEEAITTDNIDLLPKDVRMALYTSITDHEATNDFTLEAEIKN